MNRKLDIQYFIEQHSDWEKLLSEKPYCITVSREKWNGLSLLMLKYNQVDSNFNFRLVRECRGIIFNENTLEPVSYPFNKFGNKFGNDMEGGWVDDIDWKDHPYVLEKLDGSLIKVAKVNGQLLVSTNGTILASKAQLNDVVGCKLKSYEDLFWWTLEKQFGKDMHSSLLDLLDEGFTYMFELCTNYNRVVVPHPDPRVYFIGVRDNKTFEETFIIDHPLSKVFPTPKVYEFKTFDDCIAAAKELPWDDEGYVVTSRDFKRNKVKSIAYLAAHRLSNNHCLSYSRAIDLVKMNEIDEVCSYFEEFRPALEECKSRFWKLVEDTKRAWNEYIKVDPSLPTRKDKALWITKNFKMPGIAFGLLDGKIKSVQDFFMETPSHKLLRALGYKEEKQ